MKLIVVQSWLGDWEAYDEDGLSGICGDPDCGCRRQFVRGTGDTPEEAIQEFVNALLEKHSIV